DGYLYNDFFVAGSNGDGPNQREVFVMRGLFRGTSPVNYKTFTGHVFNPQTNDWRTAFAPPPPSWGIGKEQELCALIPAFGDAQLLWKTQSLAGILTGGYKIRVEGVGVTTFPSDGIGTNVQVINEDPTISAQ